MHIAIIIDEERLNQEQSMLNRLCIGLMAESMQVTRIVPDTALPDAVDQNEQRIALARRIEAPMRVLPWLRAQRTERVAESLEKKMPDVLYAVGERAWGLGIELGAQMGRPLLIDVSLPDQVRAAPLPQHEAPVTGYVVCTPELGEMLSRRVDRSMISMVPMGVALPENASVRSPEADRPIAIAVMGSGRDLKLYQVGLEAISRVVREGALLQVFLELRGPNEHELWRIAGRLDLLGVVSVIGDASLHRSLITDCDLVFLPDATGQPRSIVLEAMAHGIPVLARRDEMLQSILNESSAVLFDCADPGIIAQQISRICHSAEWSADVGTRGRSWVRERYRSSRHVQDLHKTVEQTLSGGAMKLNSAML